MSRVFDPRNDAKINRRLTKVLMRSSFQSKLLAAITEKEHNIVPNPYKYPKGRTDRFQPSKHELEQGVDILSISTYR